MRKYWFIIWVWALGLLTGCSSEVSSEDAAIDQRLKMPIYLSLAAETPIHDARDLGDPGKGDGLKLPTYLYVFFVENLLNLDGGTTANATLDFMAERLDPDLWKFDEPTRRYIYKGNLAMYLSKKDIAVTGEGTGPKNGSWVYAVTSAEELNFDMPTNVNAITTLMDNVEKTKLVLADNPNLDLLNVYANPKGDPDNGKVTKRGKFLYETNVTCYHVAARVDIQWDINPEKHATNWMTGIQVSKLPTEGYFFQHTANIAGTETKNVPITPGNQWYGRYVFHTFDTKSVHCTYTLHGVTNPFTKEYKPTEVGLGQGQDQSVFANWYRINASFGYPAPTP